jgi:hypothetical protein
MHVLVDYGNLDKKLTARSGKVIIEAVAEKVCSVMVDSPPRLTFRFYGGWYQGTGPTRLAQKLGSEFQGQDFPMIFRPSSPGWGPGRPIPVLAELAYATLADPNHHLLNTVRPQQVRHAVRVKSPKTLGCLRVDCCLRGLPGLVRNERCPMQSCSLDANQIFPERSYKRRNGGPGVGGDQ